TRQATGIGLATATDFGRDLAASGVPVISGLARGIDAAAHRGALAATWSAGDSAAPTIAVLPVGIDAIYPPSHRGLASAILEKGGTLLSEYPPGTLPATWRFPERNRVIAGMARGALVVEAPLKSGALITASHALDAGRDVFIAEAILGGPMNAGADALAAEGASCLASAGELLAEWGLDSGNSTPDQAARQSRGFRVDEGDEAFLAASLRAELGIAAAPSLKGEGKP
ncbi:MAG: DNA-processing protein DprA, partial [Spirochaetota bacterium]